MYALVTLWQLSEGPPEEALPEAVIRRARRAPGFIADFWTHERGNGKSFGIMVLDSADHAYELRFALEGDVEGEQHHGARLEMSRVQRIVLHALAGMKETSATSP
jgi:hypothetical protein